jgi:S1-C subfamily serine protease
MKIFGIVTALTLFTALAEAQELKALDHERTVLQIVLQRLDGSTVPLGTGFFVDENGTIVTALHVYATGLNLISQGRGGRFFARRANRVTGQYTGVGIELLKPDYMHDLVSFKMQEVKPEPWAGVGGIKPAILSASKEVQADASVKVIGYFGGDIFPVTVSARLVGATKVIVAQGRSVEEFLVSAAAVPGQSGSPVFLDDASVIGVVTSIVPVSVPFNPNPIPSGLNRVIKAEHIQRLLLSK